MLFCQLSTMQEVNHLVNIKIRFLWVNIINFLQGFNNSSKKLASPTKKFSPVIIKSLQKVGLTVDFFRYNLWPDFSLGFIVPLDLCSQFPRRVMAAVQRCHFWHGVMHLVAEDHLDVSSAQFTQQHRCEGDCSAFDHEHRYLGQMYLPDIGAPDDQISKF